jgi:methylmalonyl-CoA/ethylmalonyl-CoA epimerase
VKLHHVGIVTRHFLECIELYETLGYIKSVVVYDPLQMASIALMERQGEPLIEIIAPGQEQSPAFQWLKRIKAGAYHICYETPSLTEALALLRQQDFMALAEPVPAVAFGNRHVVFVWSAVTGLVELVESVPSADENAHSHNREAPLLAGI